MAQELKTQTPAPPVTPAPPRMAYEEFLEWADGIRAEWVEGEVIVTSPPILDQTRRRAEFYQLEAEQTYKLIDPDENGIYHCKVIEGLWLKVDWLWQDPLPTLMSVLKEWGLVK